MPLNVMFAQKAFIVRKGQILTLRKPVTDLSVGGYWEVPGGRLEEKETIDESLIREVQEETGLTITPLQTFHIWMWDIKAKDSGEKKTIVCAARMATVSDDQEVPPQFTKDDPTIEMIQWRPISEIDSIKWIPNMAETIRRLKKELGV